MDKIGPRIGSNSRLRVTDPSGTHVSGDEQTGELVSE